MKSSEEIVDYVQNQYWSKYFNENLQGTGRRHILQGRCGKWTIRAAFEWESTKQGRQYWQQVQEEFLSWFND